MFDLNKDNYGKDFWTRANKSFTECTQIFNLEGGESTYDNSNLENYCNDNVLDVLIKKKETSYKNFENKPLLI